MPSIDLKLDGDGAWPDLDPSTVMHLGSDWQLAVLPAGMSSGAASIALRFGMDLDPQDPDAKLDLVAETSLAAWIAATVAVRARYPEAFAGTPLAYDAPRVDP